MTESTSTIMRGYTISDFKLYLRVASRHVRVTETYAAPTGKVWDTRWGWWIHPDTAKKAALFPHWNGHERSR